MDTGWPRSPAIKSPMLSSKSPIISEKYKSGCAWGLFHFFDLRHGRKVISDTKPANRLSKGVGHSKDHRKASKSSKKSVRFPAHGCDVATERYKQLSDRNMVSKNSASMREASGNDVQNSCESITGRKHDYQPEVNVRVNMNEAVEAFVNQRLSNRSTDFIDALEILNSNKELFMKLLQDPNSLLVKHIEDLRDSRVKKPQPQSSSEAKTSQSGPMNTIVVLKAGRQNRISNWPTPRSHYSLNKKEKGISPTFMSCEHMKRKSRHASQDDFKRFEHGSKDVRKKTLRTMDKVESLPVYDLPPMNTPRRDREHGFPSPQMRFSPYSMQNTDTNQGADIKNLEGLPLYDDEKLDDELHGMQSTDTDQRTDAFNIFGKSEYLESSKPNDNFQGSPSREEISYSAIDVYSSGPLHIRRDEHPDSIIDKAKQPSSLSVLEQSFVEDNTCSPRTISPAAEPPVEPICINIEELYESSVDKQGSLSKCIRSVLQISDLNWDELSRKWHLSGQMLDSSVFDNVKVWPDKSCSTDHRLLFGYIDEVLSEIYQCYFRCSPWISLLDPRPRPALLSKDMMVHEVLRHVDWLLFAELPQQTLQQLAESDLAKSRTWMDIGLDTEEVATELADAILEDLVLDAAIQLQD